MISLGKSTSAAEIHWQLFEVYHDNIMNHLHVLLNDSARPPHSLRDGSHDVTAVLMAVS
jgi:hypothetical protein